MGSHVNAASRVCDGLGQNEIVSRGVHGSGYSHVNGISIGFPWEWEMSRVERGNGNGNQARWEWE